MFPFKKKSAPVAAPPPAEVPCERTQKLNTKLDETNSRLDEAVREMKRRLEERRQRSPLQLIGVK